MPKEETIKIRVIIEATNEATGEVDTDLVSTWNHKSFADLGLIQDTIFGAMRKLGK